MTNVMSKDTPEKFGVKLAAFEALTRKIIASARIVADDKTPLYCPDGNIFYRGIWTRDFCYLVEGAGDMIPGEDIERGIEYILRHQRPDGGIPTSIGPSGPPGFFTVGEKGTTRTDGDNSQFMVKMVEAYCKLSRSNRIFERHLDALVRALDFVPRNEDGLVWIDPQHPHTGYGFRDCIEVKGGDTFCTLLYWESARIIARAAHRLGRHEIFERFEAQARQIETHLHLLFSETAGAFIAGTEAERHADIWANAYFIHLGVPAPKFRARVLDFLVKRRKDYLQDGQVRHLLKDESWDRIRSHIMPAGMYQNGAYWGTASGWVLSAFLEADPGLARSVAESLMDDFLNRGAYECVNRGFLWGGYGVEYTKVPKYVASVANPLPLLRKIGQTTQ